MFGDKRRQTAYFFDTTITYKEPTLIGDGATDISVGNDFGLFVKQNGDLYAFGQNKFGQFGNGKSGAYSIAWTPIKVFEGVSKVYAGNNMSMIILTNGDLYSSGDNIDGRLGTGESNKDDNVLNFTKITDKAKKLFINKNSVYLIKTDDELYAWGDNGGNMLGDNSSTVKDRYEAVKITENVSNIAFGTDHVILIKTSGEVYCYGANDYWQTSNVEKLTNLFIQPIKYAITGVVVK